MASTVTAQPNWTTVKQCFVMDMYEFGVEIELLKKWELDPQQDQFLTSITQITSQAIGNTSIQGELCRGKFEKHYAKALLPQPECNTPFTQALENEIGKIKTLIQVCSLSPETKTKALKDRRIVVLYQEFQHWFDNQQLPNGTSSLGFFYATLRTFYTTCYETTCYEQYKMPGPEMPDPKMPDPKMPDPDEILDSCLEEAHKNAQGAPPDDSNQILDSCLEEVHENAQGAPAAAATHSKEEPSNESLGENLAYLFGVSVETIAKWERNPEGGAVIFWQCANQQSGDQNQSEEKQILAFRQQFENHYREVAAPPEDSPLIKKIKHMFKWLQDAITSLELDEKIRKQALEDPLRMKVWIDIGERRKKNGLTASLNSSENRKALQEGYIQHYNAQQPKDANVIVKADPTPSLDLDEKVIVKADPTPSLDQIAHMRNGASLTGKQILWLTPPLLLGAFLALPHTLLRIAIAVYSVGLCRLLYELRQIESVCQEIEQIPNNQTAAATINSRLKQLFKEIYFVQYA